MNPCQRYRKAILDRLDGELDILEKKELDKHLMECPGCEDLEDCLKKIRHRLMAIPRTRTSEHFQILLRERIRRENVRRRTPAVFPFLDGKQWIIGFGTVAVVSVLVLWSLDRKILIFRSAPKETVTASLGSPAASQEIQYMLDEFPDRVAIARSDTGKVRPLPGQDTLHTMEIPVASRVPLTPVSF